MAQWKRAGPITQRSVDRSHDLLNLFIDFYSLNYKFLSIYNAHIFTHHFHVTSLHKSIFITVFYLNVKIILLSVFLHRPIFKLHHSDHSLSQSRHTHTQLWYNIILYSIKDTIMVNIEISLVKYQFRLKMQKHSLQP